MSQFDVLIIGAGPAGAVAAHRLASAGAAVGLLEKSVFPRDKSCGDGVTEEGLMVLQRTGLTDWADGFASMHSMRITSPDEQVLDLDLEAPPGRCFGRTIPRQSLDDRLVSASQTAGAQIYENNRVNGVEINEDGVHLQSNGKHLQSRLLILADGSHAPVSRKLGLVRHQPDLVAIRQYRSHDPGPADRLEFHFQRALNPGYSWLFPLGDGRINLGTGTYTWRVQRGELDLRQALENLVQQYPGMEERLQKTTADAPPRSHPLRANFGRTQTHAQRVMVIGDAAELVSPFSGEGISPAMVSAEMAAVQALQALELGDCSAQGLAGYTRALRKRYASERRAGMVLQRALRYPWLINRIMRNLQKDSGLALLVGLVVIDQLSPEHLLTPGVLLRLLR